MKMPASFLPLRGRTIFWVIFALSLPLQLSHPMSAFRSLASPYPDHLVPIPAYDPDGYNQAVFESFIGQRRPELWMIVKPSFEREFAVLLFCHEEPVQSSEPIKSWEVESAEAKAQIWKWKKVDDQTSVLDVKATNDLDIRTAPISAELAAKVTAAWRAALLQTRYPKQDQTGVDGVTFEFYYDYDLFGQTWSPEGGVPLLLSELGMAFARIPFLQEDMRQPYIDKCLDLADQILALTAKTE